MKKTTLILIAFLFTLNAKAKDFKWSFLDTKAMGAEEFIKQNPEYDGQDVIIFVLDNAVDPAIPGLTETSTGKTKVIDMQDFSGQTVLPLAEAEKDTVQGRIILKGGGAKLEGWEKLALSPADDTYHMSVLTEAGMYKNSPVPDLNNNGKKNDEFAFLAFKIDNAKEVLKNAKGLVEPEEEMWVYYVDEDADGNIDDETPKFNYKYNYDTFDFFKGDENTRPLVTMSANIQNNSIVVNSSDGSHGSHCAGIAAGYEIYGNEGYNGIAPGAYVASLKIGSNALSGGATTTESMKKAFEYGIKFMEEAGFDHAVYSMSYGIGAELPNKTEIADFLNNFAVQNPEAVIVNSNGNEGPGIRSTGTPAGADRIISVGAMLPPETLKELYGSARKDNWMTHFSSRGSAVAKPDVVAPAGASSTVPAYEHGDRFWGTSMSCPQVAGACALLLSAAQKENLKVNSFMIKKALKFTAKPLKGYTAVDYGNGLVNIPEAYKYLKILSERKEYDKIIDYKISTTNVYYPSQKNSASYWNAGGYFPAEGEKQNVSIDVIFPNDMPEKDKHDFYRALSFDTDQPWLDVDRSKVYLRGKLGTNVGLLYDHSKMKKPGLYVGRVKGEAANEDNGGYYDMDIQTTVVIPYEFTEENNYTQKWTNNTLDPGDIDRIFVEVPAGASSMTCKLTPSDDDHYGMAMYLLAPDGSNEGFSTSISEKDRSPVIITKTGDELQNGIWEIVPYCYYQSRKSSSYDLEVKFYGLESKPNVIKEMTIEAGEFAKTEFSIFNHYNEAAVAKVSGSIKGYMKKGCYSQSGSSKFTKSIKIGNDVKAASFFIDMPAEEYGKVTDLAVNIYDGSGKALVATGMGRKNTTISFRPPSAGTYKLEMVPAFTSNAVMSQEWNFSIEEKYHYKSSIGLNVNDSKLVLYPQTNIEMSLKAADRLPIAPEGYNNFGEIKYQDINTEMTIKKQPVVLK